VIASADDETIVVRTQLRGLRGPSNRETLMPFTFSLPNPLSRLTGLIETVERARVAAAHAAQPHHPAPADNVAAASQTAGEEQLESLSLSRHGDSLEAGSHDLEAMSLGRVGRGHRAHPDR
jgi:hypothetical protein